MESLTADDLRDEFRDLTDWDERLQYIIEFGDELPTMPPELRIETNRVQGCVSNVWLVAHRQEESNAGDAVLEFEADSDAVITRGLIAIIVALLHGKRASEILSIDVDGLFAELDLQSHLTRSRSNGLRNMVRHVRELAKVSCGG